MSSTPAPDPVLLVAAYGAGESARSIGERYGVPAAVVYREVYRASRATASAEWRRSRDAARVERDDRIVSSRVAGESVASVAEAHGVSTAVVYAAQKEAPDFEERRARAREERVAAERADLVERARAYALANPGFGAAEGLAAVEHKARDEKSLRTALRYFSTLDGRATPPERLRSSYDPAEVDEDLADYVAGRATLAVLGARRGVSPETIRKRLRHRDPDPIATRNARRLAERERAEGERRAVLLARLRALAEEAGGPVVVDRDFDASSVGLLPRDRAFLRTSCRDVVLVEARSESRRASSEEVVAAVREVAASAGLTTLRVADYERLRVRGRHPFAGHVATDLGWSNVVALAGLESVSGTRASASGRRSDRFSDEYLAAAVRVFVDGGGRRSASDYGAFARSRALPSFAIVRFRLGSWRSALGAALALEPGRAEEVLAEDRRSTTEEETLEAVREVAALAGGEWLTVVAYERLRDRSRHPSGPTVKRRLGWSNAVLAATGLAGPERRS